VLVQNGEAAIKCIQGDGSDMTAKVCAGETDASATKCSQPKFVEYTGLSAGVKYACGACKSGTTATCEDCTGKTDAACNTKKETGADFKCHNWEVNESGAFTMKTASTTCKRLKATKIMCNMPGDKADKTYKLQNNGCGPCTDADKKAGKCAECDTAECNKTPIKCIQGDGSDTTAKVCATEAGKAPAAKCHQPKFVEFTGLAAGQTYGCGACASDAAAKCKDCTGKTDAACNTKEEVGADFKCYDYELKEEKWAMKKDAVTCKRLKATAIKCNMPGTKADKTYKHASGCGPCTADDKKANKCAECDKGECNKDEKSSASTITALAFPLIATLYTLL